MYILPEEHNEEERIKETAKKKINESVDVKCNSRLAISHEIRIIRGEE
jgi:hypothetical protein